MAASMTTAVTQAVDTPAGAATALPALSSTGSSVMTAPMWSIVVLLVGLAVTAGWALYARAVRVDRLHTSTPLEGTPSSHPASSGAALPTPITRSRALIESDLSRVLRTVVSEPARRELSADPLSLPALNRLDRACSRLVLARRFHNTHVSEAQALRARPLVRMCHLAGHAPMPQTFDADDDTTPEAPPERDDEVQPR